MSLDGQEIFVAGKDTVKLLGPQDLVLGEVNLAAAPGRGIDEAVDGLAAGGLVAGLGVELEVEAVAVFGEEIRQSSGLWARRMVVTGGQGDDWQMPSNSTIASRAADRGKVSWTA